MCPFRPDVGDVIEGLHPDPQAEGRESKTGPSVVF